MTQREYVKKMNHAERMIEEKTTALKRLVTSLRLWQRRAKYYAMQATKSDEQRAQEREVAKARRRQRAQRVRKITV